MASEPAEASRTTVARAAATAADRYGDRVALRHREDGGWRERTFAEVGEFIQAELDRANAKYAQVEQIKKFELLDHDFSHEAGELTPTQKIKRNVVNDRYADLFEKMYGQDRPADAAPRNPGPPPAEGERA
jgi:long-subunit acyl-CoA synthetase (AMP-forming)